MSAKDLIKQLLKELTFPVAVMIWLMMGIALPFYLNYVLFFCAYILIAFDTIKGGFTTLIVRHRMSEEFLMSIATFGAIALQDFPEAIAVLAFYRLGEIFESYAQGRSHREIASLVALKPRIARVVNDNGTVSESPLRKVKVGSTLEVLKGDLIGIDGILLTDFAQIDTKALTGESEPYLYKKGDTIPSGCINLGKVIRIKTTVASKDSSISKLIALIEESTLSKSKPEALITRFATYYTPIVILAAVLLALVPLFVENASFSDWFERALVFLVISCPCALVLSVPLSFFGGLGAISKQGVMVKGSVFIENLAKIQALCFDKTGTLTKASFSIENMCLSDGALDDKVYSDFQVSDNKALLLSILYAVENKSSHPIAKGICNYAQNQNTKLLEALDIEEIEGKGLRAHVNGHLVLVGSDILLQNNNITYTENEIIGSKVYVSCDNTFVGSVSLLDEIKDNATKTIDDLKALGVKSYLISGDKEAIVSYIAKKLKVFKYYSQQLPEDKLNLFKDIKAKEGTVGFVGDGINDAPSLALSDVGIAMGKLGAQSAIEASDVVVMTDDISKIAKAIEISRKTVQIASQNIFFVIFVKVLILILGALGFANIWLAVLGDSGLCVLAALNAMRTMGTK